MAVPVLNGVATQAGYVDALTVIFPVPRSQFQIQVSNNAIYYQLASPGPTASQGDVVWEGLEHLLLPSFTTFDDNDASGIGAQGDTPKLAGIRVRSAQPGNTAIVSVG